MISITEYKHLCRHSAGGALPWHTIYSTHNPFTKHINLQVKEEMYLPLDRLKTLLQLITMYKFQRWKERCLKTSAQSIGYTKHITSQLHNSIASSYWDYKMLRDVHYRLYVVKHWAWAYILNVGQKNYARGRKNGKLHVWGTGNW